MDKFTKYKFLITVYNVSILIKTDSANLANILKDELLLSLFLPDFFISLQEEEKLTSFDYCLTCIQSDEKKVFSNFRRDDFLLLDDWISFNKYNFLAFLLSLFQSKLILNSIYILHAAAVQYNDIGLILIGDSGSGKTTSMLELLKIDKGFKIIGNNRVAIESKETCVIRGGATGISLRKNMDINEYIDIHGGNHMEIHGGRKLFRPEYKSSGEFNKIRKIIFIALRLNPGVEEYSDNLGLENSHLLLYPELLGVKDREVVLFNGTQAIPLLYNEYEVKQKVIEDTAKIINQSVLSRLARSR